MKTKIITELIAENIRQYDTETYQNAIIKSGFDDFDEQFGGFFPGEFVVVGGRPAMGKTQFLINLSLNISVSVPVLYVTLDWSELLLTTRFISSVTHIPTTNILLHKLDYQQKRKLYNADKTFKNRKLLLHDCCDNNIESLLTDCQKHIREDGVKMIIIDYLQLLNSQNHRNSNRDREMSHICRELKKMCKENNICVIAASQLNRSLEHRGFHNRPQLHDLRESGGIEQDADKVLFIYRPEYYGIVEDADGNNISLMAEIIVAKNRNGRLGEFQLLRDEDFTNFQNIKDEFSFSSDRLNELEDIEEETPF